MKYASILVLVTLVIRLAHATEFHVSTSGSDDNDGSASNPFETISAAARVAQPGDVITVHAGVDRERINPARQGRLRIQAAERSARKSGADDARVAQASRSCGATLARISDHSRSSLASSRF